MVKVAESSIAHEGSLFSAAADHDVASAGKQEQWLALYTRSRHEKIVTRELTKQGIETFLPLRKIKKHWSDRVKLVEEPLFHSYVFTKIPTDKKIKVLNTYGAVSFVHFGPNLPAIIPEKDIFALKRFTEQDLSMDPFPYLAEGQRVYIRSGAFKGVEGFIVRKNHQCRLVISVDVLQQSIGVEVDASAIELC